MAQGINRVPDGLLSLFQIKSLGRPPRSLSDEVKPVVDLSSFYYTNLGIQITTASATALDANDKGSDVAAISIPDNQIWLVLGVGSSVTCTTFNANEFMISDPGIDNINASQAAFYFTNSQRRLSVANLQMNLNDVDFNSVTLPTPIMFPGGVRFYSLVSRAGGTTAKFRVDTRVLHYIVEK